MHMIACKDITILACLDLTPATHRMSKVVMVLVRTLVDADKTCNAALPQDPQRYHCPDSDHQGLECSGGNYGERLSVHVWKL